MGAPAALAVQRWLRGRSMAHVFIAANVVVFVVSILWTGRAALDPRGSFFAFLGPSDAVLDALGACDPYSVIERQEYWRLLTAAFLHVGLVHIVFNSLAIRALGQILEELYGPVRFTVLYMGSAIVGNLAIVLGGAPAVGASGAVFGMLGAGVAFGTRRGGTFGALLRGEFGRWVLYNVLFTFAVPGISIAGHLGGLGGGFVLGWVLTPPVRRSAAASAAPPWLTLLAALLLILVPVSFGASVLTALGFFGDVRTGAAGRRSGATALTDLPLTPRAFNEIGLENWIVAVPERWGIVYTSPQALAFAGKSGAVLLVERVNTEGDRDPVELVEGRVGADWRRVEILGDRGPGAATLTFERPDGYTAGGAARRFVHARLAGTGTWLVVTCDAAARVDPATLRDFFERVVESIRKA